MLTLDRSYWNNDPIEKKNFQKRKKEKNGKGLEKLIISQFDYDIAEFS